MKGLRKGHGAPIGNRNAAGPHVGHGRTIAKATGAAGIGGLAGAGAAVGKIGVAHVMIAGKVLAMPLHKAAFTTALHTAAGGLAFGPAGALIQGGAMATAHVVDRFIAKKIISNIGTTAAIGAAAGLATYGAYKGYQHYKNKGKK